MKNFRCLLFAAAIAPLAFADDKPAANPQDNPAEPPPLTIDQPVKPIEGLPEKSAAPLMPDNTSQKPAFTEPLPLIPDTPKTVEKPKSSSYRAPSLVNNMFAKKGRASGPPGTIPELIHMRELKTRALADGKLQQRWDAAQLARTDPEKREEIKNYYALLYDRLGQLDPQIKDKMERKKTAVIARFDKMEKMGLRVVLNTRENRNVEDEMEIERDEAHVKATAPNPTAPKVEQ